MTEEMSLVVKSAGFVYSFDMVRGFLAGLVMIKDDNGEDLFPNLLELERGESSLASSAEITDDLMEDFFLVLEVFLLVFKVARIFSG